MAAKKKKKTVRRKKVSKKRVVKKITRKKVVKKVIKKSVKKARKAAPRVKKVEGKVIGKVTHYFPHVNAGVIKLKAPLAVGDTIKIKGHTTDLTQTITSMQIDRVPITQGKKGDEIGLLVDSRVRGNDIVYKVQL